MVPKSGVLPYGQNGPEVRQGFERNNPELFVKNWTTPTLIIHGGKDLRVPLTEGLQTFTALQLLGIDSQFNYYPLENHWVLNPANQVHWDTSVFSWLAKYLKS